MAASVMVAGGTGMVGRLLVNLLVRSGKFAEIKVLVRLGSNYINTDVFVVEVDFDHPENFRDHLKADLVFCCLGTTIKKAGSKENFYKVDYGYPFELAKIVLDNGARQFNIITALGANPTSSFFYNRVKGEIENSLSKLGFENLNIFRPSLLIGKRDKARIGEQIGTAIARTLKPFLVGGLRKYRGIHAEVVARAMMNASLQERTGVQIFESAALQKLGSK